MCACVRQATYLRLGGRQLRGWAGGSSTSTSSTRETVMSVICPKCQTPVAAADRSTIYMRGMCTHCYLLTLPPVSEQRRQLAELDTKHTATRPAVA